MSNKITYRPLTIYNLLDKDASPKDFYDIEECRELISEANKDSKIYNFIGIFDNGILVGTIYALK